MINWNEFKVRTSILKLAVRQALKSPMTYKHGAVLVSKNRVIGTGYNSFCSGAGNVVFEKPGRKKACMHAELSALKGLRHDQIRGSTMFVVRVSRANNLRMSLPCKRCASVLKRKGVRKVTFSTGRGHFEHVYL